MARFNWEKRNREKELRAKGKESAFPADERGKPVKVWKWPRYRSKQTLAEKIGRAQRASLTAKKQEKVEVPLDRRAPPPKQRATPTFDELSQAFKMRAAGIPSPEIHAAFPHINTITGFMNKAKDHPDYCQGSKNARTKKNIAGKASGEPITGNNSYYIIEIYNEGQDIQRMEYSAQDYQAAYTMFNRKKKTAQRIVWTLVQETIFRDWKKEDV